MASDHSAWTGVEARNCMYFQPAACCTAEDPANIARLVPVTTLPGSLSGPVGSGSVPSAAAPPAARASAA